MYSRKLLRLLTEGKKFQQSKDSLLSKIAHQFKICFTQLLLFIFYAIKGGNLTIIAGDSVRFGTGSFDVIEPILPKLMLLLWQNKLKILYILPNHEGYSFRYLLEQELNQGDNSIIQFMLTAQNILMIKYKSKQIPLMVKLAATDSAKAYLQRQVVTLSNNKYLSALNAINLEHPRIVAESFDDDIQVLIQSYIEGCVHILPYSRVDKLLVRFNLCLDITLQMNKKLTCKQGNWQAYSDFSLLPLHHLEYKNQLTLIISHVNNWLKNSVGPSVHIHGDYHFGNIIFDSTLQQVKGMIDFDRSTPGGTELHDTLMLFLTVFATSANGAPMYFGEVINRLLKENDDRQAFREILSNICLKSGYSLFEVKCMVIILWLFILQSAMREGLTISQNWRVKMLDQTVPVAYNFCMNLINIDS